MHGKQSSYGKAKDKFEVVLLVEPILALCDGRIVFTIDYLAITALPGTYCPSIVDLLFPRAMGESKLEACAVDVVDSEGTV